MSIKSCKLARGESIPLWSLLPILGILKLCPALN